MYRTTSQLFEKVFLGRPAYANYIGPSVITDAN